MAQAADEKRLSSYLLSSLDDFLDVLPDEEHRGDEIWEEQPVDLETWLYSPEYMNLTIRLSPIQLEFMQAVDDWNPETNTVKEAVAEWGKGSGKDFIASLLNLRCVYFLLCLRDPYTYHDLARGTGIELINVAVTKDQAQHVYLKQVKGLLKGSPWFRRKINIDKDITRTRIVFPNDIVMVSAASDGDTAEGNNLICGVMDEASAFKTSVVVKAIAREEGQTVQRDAEGIYKVMRSSANSRFPRVGKVIIISYPRYKGDFTQQKRLENAERDSGFASGPYATWEVNPNRKKSDFQDDYDRNPEQAAAMYECKPPHAADAYVSFPHRFIECVTRSIKMGLRSPIDDTGAYDPFFQGEPGAYYGIHVDLALRKDRCALALARQGEPVESIKCGCNQWNFPTVEACTSCGRPKSQWVKQLRPTMVVTLLRHFKPHENDNGTREVDFSEVRDEIVWLRDRGHKIWALSYDGWNSVDSVQTMRKILGARKVRDRWGQHEREEEIVNTLSVDRNTEAHDTLKEFIYDGRFFITPPADIDSPEDWETSEDPVAIAYREWRTLRQINGRKIDHPIGGSKDFVDALAGAAYWVARMPIRRSRGPLIGGWSEQPVRRR